MPAVLILLQNSGAVGDVRMGGNSTAHEAPKPNTSPSAIQNTEGITTRIGPAVSKILPAVGLLKISGGRLFINLMICHNS